MFANVDRDRLLLKRCFSYNHVDLDFRRVKECVMNQAMMDRSHDSFRLLFSQRPRARDKDSEIAESGRLFQLFRSH